MQRLFLLLTLLTFVACSQSEKQEHSSAASAGSITEQVDAMLDNRAYTDALELLAGQEETAETLKLKEKTHLNYGLYLEYDNTNTEMSMRDKMTGAMYQYIEVLKINPDNEKAISEVEQILGIYSTFPNRQPDPAVVEELRNLGFKI